MWSSSSHGTIDMVDGHADVVSASERKEVKMLDNQTSTNPANWQIADGMTVYGMDGSKLGSVRNYDSPSGYLDVHKGWLFTKDFYVPVSTVTAVDEDGITLSLTKDDLQDARYNTPPLGPAVYGTKATLADGSPMWSEPARKEPREGGGVDEVSRVSSAHFGTDGDGRDTEKRGTTW